MAVTRFHANWTDVTSRHLISLEHLRFSVGFLFGKQKWRLSNSLKSIFWNDTYEVHLIEIVSYFCSQRYAIQLRQNPGFPKTKFTMGNFFIFLKHRQCFDFGHCHNLAEVLLWCALYVWFSWFRILVVFFFRKTCHNALCSVCIYQTKVKPLGIILQMARSSITH
mgnify:CR=1 FL=1